MSLRNLPDANTSITLDFLKGKKLDPRITFERASSATEIGEGTGVVNGQFYEFQEDVPRLTDKGLLIEQSSTNGLTHSTAFLNGIYTRSNVNVTDNVAVAPDGTLTASTVMEKNINNTTFGVYPGSLADSLAGDWAGSVFVKPNGRDYVSLRLLNGTSGGWWHTVTFALIGEGSITQELSATSASYTNISRSIKSVGNGWYRITLGATIPGNVGAGQFWPLIVQGTDVATPTLVDGGYGAPIYTGDSTKGYYLWGAQREDQKNFATSYIPTSGATVTRAVDLVTLSNNNFTDWFNNSEGTWVIGADVLGSGTTSDYPRLLQTNQSANFEYQTLNTAPGSAALAFQGWLTGQSTKTPYGIAPKGEFKVAANYSIGNTSPIYIDGTEHVRSIGYNPGSAAGTPPTELRIFRQSNGGQFLSGHLRFLSYYPTSVPDSSLEALTS